MSSGSFSPQHTEEEEGSSYVGVKNPDTMGGWVCGLLLTDGTSSSACSAFGSMEWKDQPFLVVPCEAARLIWVAQKSVPVLPVGHGPCHSWKPALVALQRGAQPHARHGVKTKMENRRAKRWKCVCVPTEALLSKTNPLMPSVAHYEHRASGDARRVGSKPAPTSFRGEGGRKKILLPLASPPRRESTPSNAHTKLGKNDINTSIW